MTPDQITQLRTILKDTVEMVKTGRVYKGDYWHDEMDEKLNQALALLPCPTCNDSGEIPDDLDDCGGVVGACVEIMHVNGELMKPCPDCQ